jgi:hypothetical protein
VYSLLYIYLVFRAPAQKSAKVLLRDALK